MLRSLRGDKTGRGREPPCLGPSTRGRRTVGPQSQPGRAGAFPGGEHGAGGRSRHHPPRPPALPSAVAHPVPGPRGGAVRETPPKGEARGPFVEFPREGGGSKGRLEPGGRGCGRGSSRDSHALLSHPRDSGGASSFCSVPEPGGLPAPSCWPSSQAPHQGTPGHAPTAAQPPVADPGPSLGPRLALIQPSHVMGGTGGWLRGHRSSRDALTQSDPLTTAPASALVTFNHIIPSNPLGSPEVDSIVICASWTRKQSVLRSQGPRPAASPHPSALGLSDTVALGFLIRKRVLTSEPAPTGRPLDRTRLAATRGPESQSDGCGDREASRASAVP